jgi:hypothetical protein
MAKYIDSQFIDEDDEEECEHARDSIKALIQVHFADKLLPLDTFEATIQGKPLEVLDREVDALPKSKPQTVTKVASGKSGAVKSKPTAVTKAAPASATKADSNDRPPPKHRLMLGQPSQPVAIVDLTVDDLEEMEAGLDSKQELMITRLAANDWASKAPKEEARGKAGRIVYKNPHPQWQASKVWEFTQVQGLVNLLTTLYGLDTGKVATNDALKRAEHCAIKLGFFPPCNYPVTKARIDAHLKVWLPDHLRTSFVPYMAILEGILGPSVNSDAKVRKHYKFAKSAILKGRFGAGAVTLLIGIIQKAIQTSVEMQQAAKDATQLQQ